MKKLVRAAPGKRPDPATTVRCWHSVYRGRAGIERAEPHARRSSQRAESSADTRARGEDARPVVLEPVGKILDFLVAFARDSAGAREGRARGSGRGDFHFGVTGSQIPVTGAVVVEIGDRPVRMVRVGAGIVKSRVQVGAGKPIRAFGGPGGQIGISRGRERRVIQRCGRVGVRHQRAVAVGPRAVGGIRIVVQLVVGAGAAEEVVNVAIVEIGNLVRVRAAAIRGSRARVEEKREVHVLFWHEFPLHRAGIIEREHDVRRHLVFQRHRHVGDVGRRRVCRWHDLREHQAEQGDGGYAFAPVLLSLVHDFIPFVSIPITTPKFCPHVC